MSNCGIYEDLPDIDGLIELHHNNEAEGDQYEPEIEQQHQTADALDIRAERIWRRHRLDLGATFRCGAAAAARLCRAGHRVDAAWCSARHRTLAVPAARIRLQNIRSFTGSSPLARLEANLS